MSRIQTTIRRFTFAVCATVFLVSAHAQTPNAGRRGFLARCVGCHGDDGTGGGHGPDIVNLSQPRGVSAGAIRDLILKGIPEAGMPSFQMPAAEADAIAAYVMTLKAPRTDTSAPSTPVAGIQWQANAFYRQRNCTSCHMVQGHGGVLGPNLSNVGHDRKPALIEQALLNPGGSGQPPSTGRRPRGDIPSYRAVTVRLKSGETIRGLAKNESAFDLQVQGVDGKLHLLLRDQVAEVIFEKSLMPKLEATPKERQDLLAYLTRLTMNPSPKPLMAAVPEEGAGISFADVASPKPGSWPTYHGNESGNRFSPLDQINTSNIGQLAPKWMYTIGAPRGGGPPKVGVPTWSGLEVTPLVVDGVMYVTSVNEAWALDARSAARFGITAVRARKHSPATQREASTAVSPYSATASSWSPITLT